MADGTHISWTDATWNPIRARNRETGGVGHFCVHVSDGCRNCYAEHMQRRFRNRVRYAAQDRSKVDLFLDEKVLMQPLRWRKPRMIFPCSMTDLFFEDHPDEWIDRIMAVMALTPQHIYQPLTKRAARMRRYVTNIYENEDCSFAEVLDDMVMENNSAAVRKAANWQVPLPNVWLGVSVEDQKHADERIPLLLDTPAAVRWISAEPLLGPVDLRRIQFPNDRGVLECWDALDLHLEEDDGSWPTEECDATLDWVVAGGESAQNKPGRPMHPDWARSLRDQCQAAGVPFHFKQWGDWLPGTVPPVGGKAVAVHFWPLPSLDAPPTDPADSRSWRVGARRAGRLLDGRAWNEMPKTKPSPSMGEGRVRVTP